MIIFDNCKDINNLNIKEQYFHDPQIKDIDGYTMAFRYAIKGIIPPKQWEHDPNMLFRVDERKFLQDLDYCYGYTELTIGMILARQNIIPPIQWINNQEIYGCQIFEQSSFDIFNNINLQDILEQQQLPVPKHTKEQELTIFDKACYRTIPDITYHNSNEQDKDGFTVAMILAINNIKIPKEWYHEPSIQNKYGYTVALLQAKQGIVPDKQWIHNKNIRVKFCDDNTKSFTVQNILKLKNIEVPQEWKIDNIIDDEENTQAMIQAKNKQIPDQQYYHDPLQTNIYGCTVAMLLALNEIIPPKEWEHDPKIKCNVSQTGGTILSQYGIVPPKQWMVTEQEDKQIFDKICKRLEIYGYKYVNNQFILNYKSEILTDTCQICFNEGKQKFIKSKCGHKVCLECFEQLQKEEQNDFCPMCRQSDWYEECI